MRSIRYRHNYANMVIGEDGSTIGKAITGKNISALGANGDTYLLPFAGFVELNTLRKGRDQFVKLINISQISLDAQHYCWEDIPRDHYCVGICRFRQYYVVLKQGEPITHPIESD